MLYEIKDTNRAASLFGSWEETFIWSCLQGIMGKIYADDLDAPATAMAVLGDFTFVAGKPKAEFIAHRPDECKKDFRIIVPQNESWKNKIIDFYGKKAKLITRYALKKEPHVFDKMKLEDAVASLPKPYTISMINKQLYHMCKTETWSSDFVAQFPDDETYNKLGIGAVICKENRIISGASSYSRYKDGIEIEIATREEYRHQGFAYLCGAKLILECLKRNLYPSWDAHNKASVALAEKLGYHYSHSYEAIEVYDN